MPGSAAGTEDTAVDKADRFYFHGAPVPKQETDKYIKRDMEQWGVLPGKQGGVTPEVGPGGGGGREQVMPDGWS